MAEPTIKDVLDAVSRLERGQGGIRAEMNEIRAQVNERFDGMDKRLNERFDGVDKRLDKIQKQLNEADSDPTKHMKVHAVLEKDFEAIKRRPLRTAARAARRRG